jgi:hypothetical protein
MSFEWVSRWQKAGGQRGRTTRTLLRTSERVLVAMDGGRQEWLFERNPVDPRRVSAYRIDHERREIVAHQEADLRNRLRLRGWDVLALPLDPGALEALRATGERETAAGASFERHVAPEPASSGIVEVWWSAELLAPLRLSRRDGEWVTTSTLESVDLEPGLDRLGDPRARFPRYEAIDAADEHDHRHRVHPRSTRAPRNQR